MKKLTPMQKTKLLAIAVALILVSGVVAQTQLGIFRFDSASQANGNSNNKEVQGNSDVASANKLGQQVTDITGNPSAESIVNRCNTLLSEFAGQIETAQQLTGNFEEPINFTGGQFNSRRLSEKDYIYLSKQLDMYEQSLRAASSPNQVPIKYYFYIREVKDIINNQEK